MTIRITLTAGDVALVKGFAASTNWTAASGLTREAWLSKKIAEYVRQQAVVGDAQSKVTATRDAYLAAYKTALAASTGSIPPPTME